MNRAELIKLLQSDERELNLYIDRATFHCKTVHELDIEVGQLKEQIETLETLAQELVDALHVVERYVDAITATNANQKLLDATACTKMVIPKAKEALRNEKM